MPEANGTRLRRKPLFPSVLQLLPGGRFKNYVYMFIIILGYETSEFLLVETVLINVSFACDLPETRRKAM